MAKLSKSSQRKIQKQIKKLPAMTKFIAVVVFLIAAIGTFGFSHMLQKNDRFELIGEKIITMNVNGNYTEPELDKAIECISFGRNVINTVSIDKEETTYNPSESPLKEGTYYIVYKTSDFKYSSIVRMRTIIVNLVEPNEDGIGD